MQLARIDINTLRGLSDKALGLTKEFVGTFSGSERLQREGEEQQARATAQLRALRKEVKAAANEAKAQANAQRQRAAPRTKEHA